MAFVITPESMVATINKDIKEFRKCMDALNMNGLKKGEVYEYMELSKAERLCLDIDLRIQAYTDVQKFGPFPYEDLLTPRLIATKRLTQEEARKYGKTLVYVHVTKRLDDFMREIKPYRDEFYSHL